MKKWTELEELKVKECAEQGLTPTETSKILNRSISQIANRYHRLGLPSRKQQLVTEQLELRKTGMRRCNCCNQVLALSKFWVKYKNHGLSRVCKICGSAIAKKGWRKRQDAFDLDSAIKYKLYQAKYRSKACSLTIEEVKAQWLYQLGVCFYSGRPMSFSPKTDNYFSIDRIDSSLGYHKQNIVLCCHTINVMKNSLSQSVFLSWCNSVVANAPKIG